MGRKSAASIAVNKNLRAKKIYPAERSSKPLSELKTVGFTLGKQQAIELARVLLLVTQEWNEIDVTCYRLKKRRSDQTYNITVTTK